MSIHAAQLSESKYEQAQSRHLASQKESEARMAWYLFLFVAAALALVLSIVYIIYNKVRHRTRQRDEALQQARDKLQKAEAQIGNWDMALREEQLQCEEIVQLFVAMAHKEYNGKRPTKREWGKLTSVFKRHMPHVWSQFVTSKLSDQERLVALLTLIDIPSNAIATLLDISPQAVGNAKSGANQKLSGEKSASALLATLKKVSQVADSTQPTQH
jgi:DNA-binding CsgD family transcriptional regulator